ncbi:hypothetical protein [Ensifer canadensis]|uniref:5-methylcytosine restriction system specificity protein McrC n=1 Tax=Ensifer canadensis TaxID=555315 RepID=UPI0035E3C5BB
MKIPIKNLYHVFLYAWRRFPGGALADVGIDDGPDVPNLLARLLLSSVRHLVRRGLDRGYATLTEELVAPRGRLRLDRMIKETSVLRGTAICDVDDLSHDVLLNQLVKATLRSVARNTDVEKSTRHELSVLSQRFFDVADIPLTGGVFRKVAVSRHNREYSFLVRICEFLFWQQIPTQDGLGTRFKSIVENETTMSAVFEEFLRNFYRLRRTEYRVRAEALTWGASSATEPDLELLPRMVTDITMRGLGRTIIIDAKFYRSTLARSDYGERIRSNHLYQIMAYLQHERLRSSTEVAGILLYPRVDQNIRLYYHLLGIPVMVATVNLFDDWQRIEDELYTIIDCCEGYAAEGASRAVSGVS